MQRLPRSLFLACSALLLLSAACKKAESHPVPEMSLSEAKAAFDSGAAFVDANGDEFRKENGIVPHAILLSSSSHYDVAATLPPQKEKPLVFYCSSRT